MEASSSSDAPEAYAIPFEKNFFKCVLFVSKTPKSVLIWHESAVSAPTPQSDPLSEQW